MIMSETGITKGTRVSYTVMYGGTPGHPQLRTEYGRVTRIRPGGPRQEPRATIAVEAPRYPRAARYIKRYVRDVRPVSMVEVRRDGVLQPGGRFGTGELTADSNAAFEYILRHQGQSVDWACRYEGWSIVTIAPDGTETSDR